jgi:hypothetical protein
MSLFTKKEYYLVHRTHEKNSRQKQDEEERVRIKCKNKNIKEVAKK